MKSIIIWQVGCGLQNSLADKGKIFGEIDIFIIPFTACSVDLPGMAVDLRLFVLSSCPVSIAVPVHCCWYQTGMKQLHSPSTVFTVKADIETLKRVSCKVIFHWLCRVRDLGSKKKRKIDPSFVNPIFKQPICLVDWERGKYFFCSRVWRASAVKWARLTTAKLH